MEGNGYRVLGATFIIFGTDTSSICRLSAGPQTCQPAAAAAYSTSRQLCSCDPPGPSHGRYLYPGNNLDPGISSVTRTPQSGQDTSRG